MHRFLIKLSNYNSYLFLIIYVTCKVCLFSLLVMPGFLFLVIIFGRSEVGLFHERSPSERKSINCWIVRFRYRLLVRLDILLFC